MSVGGGSRRSKACHTLRVSTPTPSLWRYVRRRQRLRVLFYQRLELVQRCLSPNLVHLRKIGRRGLAGAVILENLKIVALLQQGLGACEAAGDRLGDEPSEAGLDG